MKHLAFKKLIPSFALGLIVLGCLWVIAQSSDDGNSLMIYTDKFAAVQHIQQVHLNQKEGSKTLDKIGISNVNGDTLGIGKIDPMTDRVVGFSNTTDTEASSIIAGRGNTNIAGTGALLIGGDENYLYSRSEFSANSLIFGGKKNQIGANNTVTLVSSGVEIPQKAPGSLAIAAKNTNIMAPNTAVYIGDGVSVNSGAKDSLIWGSNVQLDKPGVFVFNMKNEDINYLGNGYMYVTQASPFVPKKEHTFLVNSEYGMIIGKETSPAASVQLTIGGAVKVGVEKCSTDKKGLIFKEKNCLCGCGENGKKYSLLVDSTCKAVCGGGGSLTSASCKGSFQNASRLNPEEVLTHDVQSTLVTNAQGNKCEWICNPGYIKKDNTCQKVSGSCIGTFLNAHRVNEHEQLTTDIPSKLVRAETGKPCEWKCNEGYQYFGGHFPACKIRTYQCIGAEPAHAELILGDDKGLEEDTQRILVETASSRKCEYRCKAGYKLKNGKCKPVVKPVCKGKFPGRYDYNFIPSCLKVDQTLGTGKTAWANFSFGTIKCSKKQWETSGDCFDPKNITLFNTDTLNQSFCEVGSVDTQSLLNAYLSLNPNGDLSLKPDLDGFSHFNSFSNLGTATPSNGSPSAPPVGRRNASLGLSLLSESGGYGRDFAAISESLVAQSLCLWPHGMEDRYKFSALRNGPKPKLTYTCKNDGEEVTCPLRVRDPELTEIRGRVNPNKEVGFYVACKDGRLNNNGTCNICNTDAVSHPFTGNEALYCSNLGRASNYSYQKNSPTKIESWKYDNVNQKNVRTTQTIKVDKWEWTCKTHIGDSQQCLALKGEVEITNCFVSRMGGVTCLDVSRFDQHDNGGDGGFPGDPGSFDNGFGGNNNSKWSY